MDGRVSLREGYGTEEKLWLPQSLHVFTAGLMIDIYFRYFL